MDDGSDSHRIWMALSGSGGHWDLGECGPLLRQLVGAPFSLWWPAPYGQPVTIASDDFEADSPGLRRYRIASTIFPDVVPELTIRGDRALKLPSIALEALSERWRRVWWESIESLDQVWNTLWLAVHAGHQSSAELQAFVTQGAEVIVRAPVIWLAVQQPGSSALEITYTSGLSHPLCELTIPPMTRGLGVFVNDTQESAVVSDYEASPWRDHGERTLVRSERLRGGMVVPWHATEGLNGVLYAWFYQAGVPSPLALYAFQRYVRSIRAVVMSAQSASPYSHSATMARFTDDPKTQNLLRLLKLARHQGSWNHLLAGLADHDIQIQLTDAWGQLLRQSSEIPERDPARMIALDGLEPGTLRIWVGVSGALDKIYPHLIQTVRLLMHMDVTLNDTRFQERQQWWNRFISSSEDRDAIWPERTTHGFEKIIAQIWGIRLSQSQALTRSGRALARAVRRYFHVELAIEGRTIWVWLSQPSLPDAVESFRKEIAAQLGQPLSIIGVGVESEGGAVLTSMTRIQEALMESERNKPDGLTRFLGRPPAKQIFQIPEMRIAWQVFVEAWIGPLVHYDEQHGVDLVHTLGVYLSVPTIAQAARILFVHPNTIRCRLDHIQEILAPLNLGDPETRVNLLVATQLNQDAHPPERLGVPDKRQS